MSTAVYPDLPGLAWPIAREPVWNTGIKRTPSGREFSTTSMTSPRHRRTLKYEFLRSAAALGEYQRLFDFFNARAGQYDSFLLVDREDCNVTMQPLAIGSGSTAQYQLGRWLPGTPYNLTPYSQAFANWSLASVAVTSGAVMAPDGMLTGDQLTATAAGVGPRVTIGCLAGAPGGCVYSVHLKAGNASRARLNIYNLTTAVNIAAAEVDLAAGTTSLTTGAAATISSAANGWQRCSVAVTSGYSPGDTLVVYVYVNPIGGQAVGDYIYAWGAQLQPGTVVTAYSPNLGGTVNLPALEPVFDLADPPSVYISDGTGLWQVYPTARTNYALRSQEFDHATWVKDGVTVTANATAAPDGTTTAEFLAETSGTNGGAGHKAYQAWSVAPVSTYHVSFFIKAGARTVAQMWSWGGSGSDASSAFFDTATGTATGTGSPTMTRCANGWWRCSRIITTVAAQTTLNVGIGPSDGTGTQSYSGNGTSGHYAWGVQLEVKSNATPTRYIPTTSAAVVVTDYSVNSTGLLTFAPAPGYGAQILWSGSYYWRYRFEQDSLSLDEFMRNFWQSGQVKLISKKP